MRADVGPGWSGRGWPGRSGRRLRADVHLLASVVLVLLVGCGCAGLPRPPLPDFLVGSGDSAAPTAPPAPGGAPAAPSSAAPAPPSFGLPSRTPGPAPSGDVTPAGTVIGFGDQATVDAEYANKRGLVGFTVTSIDKGTAADLAQLKLGDQASGYTPYYIRATLTNLSDTNFEYSAMISSSIEGQLGDGSPAAPLRVIGKFRPCESGYAPSPFGRSASYRSCEVFLAPVGTVVDKAAFTGTGYDQIFQNNPIVWKRS